MQTRKRKPIRPRTAENWRCHIKYLNSKIGSMQLCDINNSTMREFVETMVNETKAGKPRFSPKTIESCLAVVKMVVASVKNDRGERVYPVQWDSAYMDVPLVKDQRTPSFTAAEIETILAKAKRQDRVLYALLAGSGLRIGEALALRVESVRDSVITVRQSAWEGTVTDPKTANATREVDLHSSLADALRMHIGERKTGLVFPSERDSLRRKSNLLRRSLHPILKQMGLEPCGFHAFRRFRAAHLRTKPVPELLVRIWLGHSVEGITDRYALGQMKANTLHRTMKAQEAGLGFALPMAGELPVAPTCAPISVRILSATV
jgi:integrase